MTRTLALRCLAVGLALAGPAAAQVPPPVPPPVTPPVPVGDPAKPTADDKLPAEAVLRLGSPRFREANFVNAAALSPDGKTLAVCNNNNVIRLLDAVSGKEVRKFNINEYLNGNQLIFTPDGKSVVTTGYNGTTFWGVEDGKKGVTIPNGEEVRKRGGRAGSISLSDDGKLLAFGSMDRENGSVTVLEVATKKQVAEVKPVQNNVVNGVLNPKGDLLATWGMHYNRGPADEGFTRTVQVWEVATGKEKYRVNVETVSNVATVKFSPDGSKLGVGGQGVVQLWDAATGKLERRFAARTNQGTTLVFSPDGKTVATSGRDGTTQMWETATGKRKGITEGTANNIGGLQYRADGQLVAWGIQTNAIHIWEVPSGKRVTPDLGHSGPVTALMFAPDGKSLVSSGQDGQILRWSTVDGKLLKPMTLKIDEETKRMYGYPRANGGVVSFAPNGKYLIAPAPNGSGSAVYDAESGLELFALAGAGGYVDRGGVLAFSPDSTKVVALNRYYGRPEGISIPVWDVETGNPLPNLKGQTGEFSSGAFSTDGKLLATASYQYQPTGQVAEVWVWDLETGKPVGKITRTNANVQAMTFLNDRMLVVVDPNSRTLPVYDAIGGKEVRAFEATTADKSPVYLGNTNGLPLNPVVSPDRRLVALPVSNQAGIYTKEGYVTTNTSRVFVWEVASGTLRHELKGQDGQLSAVAFAPDGKTLATGSSDTTIILWDLTGSATKVETPKDDELPALWKGLEETDARKAEASMRRLQAKPAEAVKLVKDNVKPAEAGQIDADKIRKWVGDLDAKRFAVREAASRELGKLGKDILGELKAALALNPQPEVKERLERLIDEATKPDVGQQWLQPLRAVELLERVGTAEAKDHLKALAAGGDTPTTRAAKEAFARLAQAAR